VLDEPLRKAIGTEYLRRRHEIPVPTEFQWHRDKPQFTIRSQWLSFIVWFTPEKFVVDAEFSLLAKTFVTQENRKTAVQMIASIADELGL
jgi:hypothetical protein